MSTYVVKLLLKLGEYEKIGIHLVEADSADEASVKALKDESHNDYAGYTSCDVWCDDNFVYQVHSCQQVKNTRDVLALSIYL